MDTGSDKRIDPELDLKTAEEQEKDDNKYVGTDFVMMTTVGNRQLWTNVTSNKFSNRK